MRTARLPTVCASVPLEGGGSQVNKFEQVSTLDRQMSVPWGVPVRVPSPWKPGELCAVRFHVRGGGEAGVRGSLHGEVQCIMGDGHMRPLPPL